MRDSGWAFLAGLGGFLAGQALGAMVGFALLEAFGVSNVDGQAATIAFFLFGPLVTLASIVTAVKAARAVLRSRRERRASGLLPPEVPIERPGRVAAGTVLGLVVGYGLGIAAIQTFDFIRGTPYYTSYAPALIAAWLPTAAAMAGGVFGFRIGNRKAPV
jgi:hypothetical protein